ncbi:MAG TPA: hypothetical protein VF622_02085 [Segetibacter sp.]|jgi:hypothetical protein
MPQEKSNNILQQKLDELNGLPDDVEFDSSSAWNKLEGRLHPVTKKHVWLYYVVAASVVGLIFTFSIQKEDKIVSAKEIAKQKEPAAKVENAATAELIVSKQNSKATNKLKPIKNTRTITGTDQVLNKTSNDLNPFQEEIIPTNIVSVLPNNDEEKAATRQPENIVGETPVRKFRIVHNNETLIRPQYPDIAKRSTSSYSGFPLFKSNQVMDLNPEEPAQEEILPQQRKKDRVFFKILSNTLKED